MSKATISLRDGYKTEIKSRDHIYYADEPVSAGGEDSAPTPTEMAMGALGACIAITMKLYAERKGWDLQSVDIDLDFERFRGSDYPRYEGDERYIHEIRKGITLHGDLTPEQVDRIKEIGGKCPVHRLIATPSFFVEKVIAEENGTGNLVTE